MARDLDENQQAVLATNPFRVERLVEIQTPAGTYYYTTGQHDVAASTDTSAGTVTYVAANGIKLNGIVRDYYQLAINEITLDIGDVGNVVYENIVRTQNNYDFTNTEVNIYLLFRNPTNGAPQTNAIVTLYKGAINKISAVRTDSENTILISVTNKFGNFDKTVGRRTSEFTKAATAGRINWGSARSI